MSEGRPHLRAVAGEKAGEGRPAPGPGRGTPGRSRVLLLVLALAAGTCAVGWVLQAREASDLRASLEDARARVAGLEETLAAREARLEGARERTTQLVDQAAGLAESVRALSGWLAEGADAAREEAPTAPFAEEPASPGEEPVAPPGAAPFESPAP